MSNIGKPKRVIKDEPAPIRAPAIIAPVKMPEIKVPEKVRVRR